MTTFTAAGRAKRGVARVSFERILVPLDGSEMAAGILPVGKDLAKRLGARVDLLAVVDPETTELPSYMPIAPGDPNVGIPAVELEGADEVQLERIRAATEYLNSVANSLREDGLEVDVEATIGDPAQEIVAKARRRHTDVIAMATRGRSAIGRGLLGSVTDKVTHSSAVPMLVVRPVEGGSAAPISRLIVGLDGSRVAEAALDPARDLAASLEVPVLLLRATAVAARMAAYGGEPYFASANLHGDTDTEAKEYLDSVAARQKELGADVDTRVGPGTAYNEILSAAADEPGSLIVLATRGRSGLTRWVLGSVTDRIIRSSDGPVLVIPPSIGGWT